MEKKSMGGRKREESDGNEEGRNVGGKERN